MRILKPCSGKNGHRIQSMVQIFKSTGCTIFHCGFHPLHCKIQQNPQQKISCTYCLTIIKRRKSVAFFAEDFTHTLRWVKSTMTSGYNYTTKFHNLCCAVNCHRFSMQNLGHFHHILSWPNSLLINWSYTSSYGSFFVFLSFTPIMTHYWPIFFVRTIINSYSVQYFLLNT